MADDTEQSASEVAAWMLSMLEHDGLLNQDAVASYLCRRWGDRHVYRNRHGGLSIAKGILREFRRLSGDTVVWERGSKFWRRRQPYDPPGRQAD